MPSSSTDHPQRYFWLWTSAVLTLLVWVTVLWGIVDDAALVSAASGLLFLAWLGTNLPQASRAERLFVGFSALLTAAAVFVLGFDETVFDHALERAALFFCFSIALSLLRDAASTSPAIEHCGRYLIGQPATQRYAALTVGAHILAIPLSVAALNLLGAMVAQANTLKSTGGDEELKAQRERRMTTALLRGHAAIVFWSPMGIGAAVTLSLVGQLDWVDLAPPAILLAAIFLAIGWLLDFFSHKHRTDRGSTVARPTLAAALLPAIGISILLVGAVLTVKAVLPIAAINDLFLAVVCVMPLASLAWIAVQHAPLGFPRAIGASLQRVVTQISLAAPARADATIIALAGYISVLLSALAAAIRLGESVSHLGIPPSYEILGVPFLIIAIAQLGINPLVAAVVFGSILVPSVSGHSTPRVVLALALQGGWVLALCTAPYSGSALMLARSISQSPWTVTAWNRTYAAICLVVLTVFNAVLLMR